MPKKNNRIVYIKRIYRLKESENSASDKGNI